MPDREFLFRGKRLDNGEWAEGYLVKYPSAIQVGDSSPWYIIVPPVDPDDNGGRYNVAPSTVSQYTGLTDKYGTRIFDGDRLYDPHENTVYTVEWNNEKAMFQMAYNWRRRSMEFACYCEAFGNRWDNPELLGGDQHE